MQNLSAELYGDEIKDVDGEVSKVVKTFIDPELIEQGVRKDKLEIVLKGIRKKLGNVPESQEEKIKSADIDTLDKAIDALLDNKPVDEII